MKWQEGGVFHLVYEAKNRRSIITLEEPENKKTTYFEWSQTGWQDIYIERVWRSLLQEYGICQSGD